MNAVWTKAQVSVTIVLLSEKHSALDINKATFTIHVAYTLKHLAK